MYNFIKNLLWFILFLVLQQRYICFWNLQKIKYWTFFYVSIEKLRWILYSKGKMKCFNYYYTNLYKIICFTIFFFFLSNNINFWNKILLLITILLIFKRKMNILVFPLVLVKRRVNIVLLCLKYNLTNLEKNNWILYLKLFTFHS